MTGIEEIAALAGELFASETVVSGAAAGLAGAGLATALAPKLPDVKPPATMPDQQATDAARRRSLAEQMARRGRASTILTDSGDTLG